MRRGLSSIHSIDVAGPVEPLHGLNTGRRRRSGRGGPRPVESARMGTRQTFGASTSLTVRPHAAKVGRNPDR